MQLKFTFLVKNLLASLLLILVASAEIEAAELGVYDPSGAFNKVKNLDYQEQFVDWYPYTNGTIETAIYEAAALDRSLLLTIQPEVNPSIGTAATLLNDVTTGKYDTIIKQICAEINYEGVPVWIRWGHEMETSQSRYPWSGQSPAEYVAAFQHVVTLMRSLLTSICYFVWSPQGQATATRYWVGSTFCNYIGFSVYSFREYDIAEHGTPQTFQILMDARYHIAYVCNPSAPVMICEMGAYSSTQKSYQTNWVSTAFSLMGDYPLLVAAIWFNSKDSVAWPPAKIPNFTTTTAIW